MNFWGRKIFVNSSILTFCNVLVNEKRGVAKKNEVVFCYYYYNLFSADSWSISQTQSNSTGAPIWLARGHYFLKTLKLSFILHDTECQFYYFQLLFLSFQRRKAFLPFLPGFHKTCKESVCAVTEKMGVGVYNLYQVNSTKILRSPQSLAIVVCLSEHRNSSRTNVNFISLALYVTSTRTPS